jgi:hypothetical protein
MKCSCGNDMAEVCIQCLTKPYAERNAKIIKQRDELKVDLDEAIKDRDKWMDRALKAEWKQEVKK